MRKTRQLPQDVGDTGDLLYYTLSGQTNPWAVALNEELQKYFDDRILTIFNKYLAYRATPVLSNASFIGNEIFDSSEMPRPQFNTLLHTKNRVANYAYSIMQESYNSPYMLFYAPYYREPFPWGATLHSIQSGSFEQWDAAARRAWWAMKPRFEGEVSMLNFLFELKDFRDIAKHMLRLRSPSLIADQMRSFSRRLKNIDSRLYSKNHPVSIVSKIVDTGASSAKVAAQIRLVNEFALKPLISDLASIMAQAGLIVREVQKDFYEKGLTEQVRHYSETEVIQDDLVQGNNNMYPYSTGYFCKEVFTATLSYQYNYKMRSDSDAFLTYWGLKFTPEVILDAIPFSFLLDYFAKFGQALHNMKVDPNVKVLPSQYCESILRTYSDGIVATGDSRAHLAINGKYPVSRGDLFSGCTGSSYQRLVKPPNKGLATPRITLPSGRQGANMAALAICFIK